MTATNTVLAHEGLQRDRRCSVASALDAYRRSSHQGSTDIAAAKDLMIDLMHFLAAKDALGADEMARLYAVHRSEMLRPDGIGPEPTVTISECGINRGHYASRTAEAFLEASMLADTE